MKSHTTGLQPPRQRRVHQWPISDRLKALENTALLSIEGKVLYCRQHGIHLENLSESRQQILAMEPLIKEQEKKQKKVTQDLENTIARKDKALLGLSYGLSFSSKG